MLFTDILTYTKAAGNKPLYTTILQNIGQTFFGNSFTLQSTNAQAVHNTAVTLFNEQMSSKSLAAQSLTTLGLQVLPPNPVMANVLTEVTSLVNNAKALNTKIGVVTADYVSNSTANVLLGTSLAKLKILLPIQKTLIAMKGACKHYSYFGNTWYDRASCSWWCL